MPYIPTQSPPGMKEFDELRRWVEEEFRRVARATAEYDVLFNTLKEFTDAGAYTEGSYTPVLTSIGGGTVPTFTATPLTGKYAKVGRLVVAAAIARNTAGGTPGAGANQLVISLPLAASASAIGGRRMAGSFVNGTTEDLAFVDIVASATTAPMYQQQIVGTNADQVPLNCVNFSNATRGFAFFITYAVD